MSFFYDLSKFTTSVVCSDNIYCKLGRAKTFYNMLNEKSLPTIQHYKSKETYLVCPSTCLVKNREAFYLNIIGRPMNKGFVWPIDMLSNGDLVFKQRIGSDNEFSDLWELTKDNYSGFENQRVKPLLINLLNNLQNLFDNGYIYRLWDEKNICYGKKTNEVIFQFHNFLANKNNNSCISKEDYYTELTDPYYIKNGFEYDFYSDMYSFQSLLFRLLIGVYPFEGERMTGRGNRTGSKSEYNGWIMEYLRNVYFVFDNDYTKNHLTEMGYDIPRIKRWESLSPKLKKMFMDVFSRSNVLRENDSVVYYTPNQWLEEIQKFDFSIKK